MTTRTLKRSSTLKTTPDIQATPFILGSGAVAAGVYEDRFRTDIGDIEIVGFQAQGGFSFAPSGANLVIDVVKGDSTTDTLWPTNPGSRPIIVDGATAIGLVVPDITLIPAGTSLRAKVATPLPGTPGSFVVLMMHWRYV